MKSFFSIILFAIFAGSMSYGQEGISKDNFFFTYAAIQEYMNNRKKSNTEGILAFFDKTDTSNININSFYITKKSDFIIKSIEIITEDKYYNSDTIKQYRGSTVKASSRVYLQRIGDIAYTIRESNDDFQTFQDFLYLLRKIDGKWLCVNHYSIGIDDNPELYED